MSQFLEYELMFVFSKEIMKFNYIIFRYSKNNSHL